MAEVGDIRATLSVNIQPWTQGLQQAAQQLSTFQQSLTGRLTPALQQTSQALTQTGTAAQALTAPLQAATRSTTALSQALTIASGISLAASVQGMVTAVVAFGRETVVTGARLEQLRASLSALAGSTAAGQAQFDTLFQSAQRLGVAFEPLVRGWRTLTAAATQAGLPLADQRRLLEAVATEGRRVGATNEELSRAFQALGQMASKGTVSMEELRQQLGEAIPTALGAMARGMGRTTEELVKLVEAGGVTFPSAARALTRGLEELGRQGSATGDTLQSAFNRFSNELVRSRDELMKMAGPLSTITRAASDFLKILNDSAQAQRQLQTARAGEALIGTGLREGDVTRLPQEQQRRLTTINRLLGEQVLAQGDPNAPPMFQPSREEYIAQLKAERDALLQGAQAIKAKDDVTKAATGEINKARAAEQLRADTLADLTKQLDALTKSQAEFRQKAALAPETFGRPGTVEFLKEQEQALRPGVEKLAQSLATLPQGVTLPPELSARAREFDTQIGQIGKSVDALKEKQAAARKAEAEAEQARKRAVSEEISLTAELARVKAFVTRPEETTSADRARLQALQQGVEMQRIVDDAMRQFEQSPALRQRAPQLLDAFTQMQQGLQAAIDTQAMQAFNQAVKKDVVEPLERLAATYGKVKEARDADEASKLAAKAQGTIYEKETADLEKFIQGITALEAQLPRLKAEAVSSALALKQVQDERAALLVLEENLEQARIPRGGGGFPFGRTREELRLQQRTGEDIRTPEGQQRAQELQRARLAQEQLNYAAGLFEQFGLSVGSAWTNALQSIADHTATVSEAFRAMAQSIIQSLGQIAAQEGFKALIGLGVRMITGAALGGAGAGGAGATAGSPANAGTFIGQTLAPQYGFDLTGLQQGGVIRAPTMALLGEGPSSTLPEYVMNAHQMDALMSRGAAPAAGAQNVSVILVDSRAKADEAALRERSRGNIVVQQVVEDLAKGESSPILRTLRTLQR